MSASRGSVLVVDDERTITEIVSAYLERAGYSTRVAANGNDALDRAAEERPDLVVLDIMLPGLDGLEVMRRLREGPGTPTSVILLTAKGEATDRIVGLELDPKRLRGQGHTTLAISHASIVTPFLLGATLALALYPIYAYQATSFTVFSLFLGVAEVAAAVGLTLPGLTRILPWLVTWAAGGVMIVTASATAYHLMRGEMSSAAITLGLLAMATFLAYMRQRVVPIGPRRAA